MKQVASAFNYFPHALAVPSLPSELHKSRGRAINEWLVDLSLRYNVHYVCFEHRDQPQQLDDVVCWAFKDKWMALQFKLKFSAWSDTNL
jgi:hypothetical protein